MGSVGRSQDNSRLAVLVVSITIFALASIFVALRFVCRVLVVRRVEQHDFWMLLAWVVDFAFSFSLFYAVKKGFGLPMANISLENSASVTRAVYAFTVLYNPALMAVKTSILVFYMTLARAEKLLRIVNYSTLLVVNVAGLALTLITALRCHPVEAAFNPPISSTASCIDIITLSLCSAPVNIITDIAMLIIPLPILTKLRLPRRQKIILIITFSFGFFVTVVDVVRIVYLQYAATNSEMDRQSMDMRNIKITSHAALSFMWSVVEVNTSVICGCVPSLKPLVARIVPRVIGVSDKGSKSTSDAQSESLESPAIECPQPKPSPVRVRPEYPPSNSIDIQTCISCDYSARGAIRGSPENITECEANRTMSSVSSPSRVHFFDFVNTSQPVNILNLNNKESVVPVAIITIIFFLWGFSYGLLGTLTGQLHATLRLNGWKSLGIHAAYFGGYTVSPLLIGRAVLKKGGYKLTFITGLFIYACGALIFWPSAVLTSYPAFTVSNFIVGSGLSILETAANSFVVLCGPLENAEIRLNITQGVQAIATVFSTLLAKKVFFTTVSISSIINVQWTYLSIALFDAILALILYYLPIPEAPDESLEARNRHQDGTSKQVLGLPVIWVTLALGFSSQYLYVASQEIFSTSFDSLVKTTYPRASISSFDYMTIGHALFAVGRFLTAVTLCFLKPRYVLMIAYIGMIVFTIICMKTSALTAIAMALMIYLFESGAFSIIFATSLRGMGRHTKTAASLQATAVGGGAFLPFAQYAVSLSHGTSYSYAVLVATFSAGAIFPLYLNLVPAAKRQVDPVPHESFGNSHSRRHMNQKAVC